MALKLTNTLKHRLPSKVEKWDLSRSMWMHSSLSSVRKQKRQLSFICIMWQDVLNVCQLLALPVEDLFLEHQWKNQPRKHSSEMGSVLCFLQWMFLFWDGLGYSMSPMWIQFSRVTFFRIIWLWLFPFPISWFYYIFFCTDTENQ